MHNKRHKKDNIRDHDDLGYRDVSAPDAYGKQIVGL